VAALSIACVAFLTVHSQAGWFDLSMTLAALCGHSNQIT
jgi:hypothetical protein